ncbi:MAG TPA: SDR family NAD(P)-dependent oxidoreductase [Rhizomicrobium sp.]
MNWNGKNVLVTGGFGFFGGNLVDALLRRGARVAVFDNLDPRSGANRANLAEFLPDILVREGDICDRQACAQAVAGQDVVFHCAALTSHPRSHHDPVAYATVNGIGTLVLVEALRRANPTARLVALGTSSQIGVLASPSADERHGEFPADIYSASKTASEKFVLALARAHGMNTTVARLGNVYGPRAHISTPDFGFVNFFVGLGLRGRDITVYGDGRQRRNLSYVGDCVETVVRLAERHEPGGEVYFATGDDHFSVAEIAEAVAGHVGGRVRFVPWPRERLVLEPGDAVIANDKLKSAIGALPSTGIADGLRMTAAYFRQHLADYLPT